MKKILLASAFPAILFLHLGVKVFFPGLFAYGSSDQVPGVALTSSALRPTDNIALALDATTGQPYFASVPGYAQQSESPTPTQP